MALVDSTSSYFAQMGAVPLLTGAGELALAQRIEEGDRQIFAALLESRVAVDELLRVAAAGTTTHTPAGEVLVDVDPRHAGFDEAARKRELVDVVAALERYRDAQKRGAGVDGARQHLDRAILAAVVPRARASARGCQARRKRRRSANTVE